MASITPSAAELTLRTNLLQRIRSITEIKVDDLVRAEKLGEMFSFAAGRSVFEKALAIYRLLASADFDLVTELRLTQLIEVTDAVLNQIVQIKSFQPQGGNPTQQRDNVLNAFKVTFDQAFGVISTVMAVSDVQKLGFYETEARGTAERLQTFFEEQTKAFQDFKSVAEKDISETLTKAKQAAQEIGIVRHAAFFATEAAEHKKMARVWLAVTSLLGLGTGVLAWFNYNKTLSVLQELLSPENKGGPGLNAAVTIQLAIAKLIVFSILFSAVVWAGRVYRAHRHNYVVNKHRQNALSTFEAFVKATDDAATKNAVLLQATQCIFGPQSTGYLTQEKDSEGPTQILEIVRGATSAKN